MIRVQFRAATPALLFSLSLQFGWGQAAFFRPLLTGSPAANSIRLQGVSAYAGYTSNVLPPGSTGLSGSQTLGADFEAGGSAAIGFKASGPRGGLYGLYTLSYTGNVRYSDFNSLNHALSLSVQRRASPRTTLSLTAAASASNLSQFLYSPTVFGYIAAAPGTFDDLAAAVLTGAFSSDQIASLLTGVPVVESPARTLFYGNRVLSASLAANLSWKASPRLQAQFSASAGRSQHLPGDASGLPQDRANFLSQSTSGTASADLSYALGARTQIGVQAAFTRSLNSLQSLYGTSAVFSAGRKIARNWFANGKAGVSAMKSARSVYSIPDGPQYIGGALLGYRLLSHTFLASYDRSAGGSYTALAGVTHSTSAAWNWSTPGRKWALFCSLGQQRTRASAYRVDGWIVSAGVERRVGPGSAVEMLFGWSSASGSLGGPMRELTRHGVRLQYVWFAAASEGGGR